MSRMKDRKNKSKRTTLRIPGMKDVEGKRPLAPEGEHLVKVVGVEEREGQNAPYFAWEFEVVSGKAAGAKIWNNTSLAPQALWNLRGTLEALGVEIPDDDTDIELSDLVDLECMVTVEHEVYEGKKQARIVDVLPVEAKDEDSDTPRKASKAAKPAADDDEDEDDKPKSRRAQRRAAARAAASEDDEDEAPRGKADKKKAKKKSGVTKEEVMDMSQDELGDLIKEHELETDLEDYATLRKMKAAVVEALEEAGVLEE